MAAKKVTGAQTAAESTTEAENSVKKEQAVNSAPKEEKRQETANTETKEGAGNADEETFIYIGPTTRTGLIENTIVKGTRESVEEYLKDAIEEIPQIKMLIVPTESLAASRAKAKQTGTLLNKYYNDVLSLLRKAKEV